MTDTSKFEMFCIVEIFGHQQIAGRVTEQTIAGTGFVRIDVPKTLKRDGFTRFYGPGAIYSMTPVDEKIAALMAERLEVEAVSEWKLSQAVRNLLPATASNDNDAYYGTADYGDGLDEDDDEPFGGEIDEDDEDDLFFGGEPDEEDPDLHAVPTLATVEKALSKLEQDKLEAAQWARDLLKGEFVIFDTETTGVEHDDEIIQIGIVNQAGDAVLEQLVKPSKPITNTAYHGLTDESVKDAPGFPAVYEQIKAAFEGKEVVAYNYEYDSRMLAQVCLKHGLGVLVPKAHCAMEQYAQYNGEWNDYHGNYRWKKLREALAAFGLKHEDFGTKEHDACTDARATLALIKKMAEFEAEKSAATE